MFRCPEKIADGEALTAADARVISFQDEHGQNRFLLFVKNHGGGPHQTRLTNETHLFLHVSKQNPGLDED